MATKTFNLKDVTASGSTQGSLQDGGSVSTSTTGTGWSFSPATAGNFAEMAYGTTRPASAFSAGIEPDGDNPPLKGCWRSETAYTIGFAAGNWVVTLDQVSSIGILSSATGRFDFLLWKSANADGSAATQITATTQQTTVWSAGTNGSVTITFNPGAFNLVGEYLFLEVACAIVTASGLSPNGAVNFRVGANSTVVTTGFTSPIAGTVGTVFGQTGAALGKAGPTGTAAAVFGQTGALVGPGTLAGTAAASFTQTGVALARGVLAGSTPAILSASMAPGGVGTLAGTSGTVLGQSAVLVGPGVLAGTVAAALGGAGSCLGLALPTGTVTAVLGQTGVLIGQAGASGSSPITFDGSVTAIADGELDAEADAVFGASAAPAGIGILDSGGPYVPTFVGSTSTTSIVTATSIVLSYPSDAKRGDLLVATVCASADAGTTYTPTAGWVLLRDDATAGNSTHLLTYTKIATDNEPGIYVWGVTPAVNNDGTRQHICAYRGVSSLDANTGIVVNTPGSSITVPGLTTGSDQESLLGVFVVDHQVTPSVSYGAPPGSIARVNTGDGFLFVDTFKPLAGATGSQTATLTSGGPTPDAIGWSLTITPKDQHAAPTITLKSSPVVGGAVEAAGTSTAVLTATGNTLASGALAATASFVFGNSSNLLGSEPISGSAAVTLGLTGGVNANGSLASSAGFVFAAQGNPNGVGTLIGAAPYVFSCGALLRAPAFISGVAPFVFDLNTNPAGYGALAGSAHATLGQTGLPSGAAECRGKDGFDLDCLGGIAVLGFGSGAFVLSATGDGRSTLQGAGSAHLIAGCSAIADLFGYRSAAAAFTLETQGYVSARGTLDGSCKVRIDARESRGPLDPTFVIPTDGGTTVIPDALSQRTAVILNPPRNVDLFTQQTILVDSNGGQRYVLLAS